MQLRWTTGAAADLEQIANYLFEKAPEHAERIVRTIYKNASQLTRFPRRGRPGKKAGTRELVLSSLPYIIVYRATPKLLYIARILHGAQKWP
jgi:toxin ParE1/3/4